MLPPKYVSAQNSTLANNAKIVQPSFSPTLIILFAQEIVISAQVLIIVWDVTTNNVLYA